MNQGGPETGDSTHSWSSERQGEERMKRKETANTRDSAALDPKSKSPRLVSLQDKLERAAHGLCHLSESDYPYRFFCLPCDHEKEGTL